MKAAHNFNDNVKCADLYCAMFIAG